MATRSFTPFKRTTQLISRAPHRDEFIISQNTLPLANRGGLHDVRRGVDFEQVPGGPGEQPFYAGQHHICPAGRSISYPINDLYLSIPLSHFRDRLRADEWLDLPHHNSPDLAGRAFPRLISLQPVLNNRGDRFGLLHAAPRARPLCCWIRAVRDGAENPTRLLTRLLDRPGCAVPADDDTACWRCPASASSILNNKRLSARLRHHQAEARELRNRNKGYGALYRPPHTPGERHRPCAC